MEMLCHGDAAKPMAPPPAFELCDWALCFSPTTLTVHPTLVFIQLRAKPGAGSVFTRDDSQALVHTGGGGGGGTVTQSPQHQSVSHYEKILFFLSSIDLMYVNM